MRTTIYLCCLLAAFLAGGALVGSASFVLTPLVATVPFARGAIALTLQLIAAFVPLLVLYRVLIFVKSRSLIIPENFHGFPFSFACVATVPVLVIIIVYGFLFLFKKSVGSGIPIALAFAFAGLISAIPILYCETKEFYAHLPGRKTQL